MKNRERYDVQDLNCSVVSGNGTEYVASDGSVWRASGFIPVSGGKTYHFNAVNSDANVAGMVWYDINKKYVSGVNTKTVNKNNGNITAPENAKYLKVSFRIDEGYNPDWQNTVQLEEGTTATGYESYKEENYIISLDEPLRCVDGSCDYIDFETGKLVRNVKAESDGTLVKLKDSISQDIDLPNIKLNTGTTHIILGTNVMPSKVQVEHYK